MPGIHHTLKANYSVETNEGFARLARMAGRQDRWPASDTGDVEDEVMLNAVYGGVADPETPREYTVYSVDWLNEHGDEIDKLDDGRATGEPVEEFRRYLDETFEGWVYHHERGEVFVMDPADSPS